MKEYISVKKRLQESRQVFNRILNEQKGGFDKSGDGKRMPDSMVGFPGQCCDGQGNVVPVTFASANDDCADISMIEPLDDGSCPTQIEPIDDFIDDFHTHGDDNNQAMISCVMCMNGSPVGVTQVPAGQPCPRGTQDSHLGDPCDGQSTNLCDDEFTLNGNAAMMAGFPNSFVSNNPSNFLTNMQNGYNQFGCQFLQARLNNHQDQLNNNIFFGPNNPQGYPNPGPLWVAQKQSKVTYLTAVLNGPCCNTTGTGPGPGVPVGPTMG